MVRDPPCFVFHLLNAYDDGDRTIVDVIRHPRMFADEQTGPGEGLPALARWTLDRSSGRLVETILDNAARSSRASTALRQSALSLRIHRAIEITAPLTETPPSAPDADAGPAIKHDLERQSSEIHDYGPAPITAEPVFVPPPTPSPKTRAGSCPTSTTPAAIGATS